MRLSFLRFVAAALTATIVLPGSASASLVQSDLVSGSGDGFITLDTGTGLEWLDLTQTVGQSYNDVAAGFSDISKIQFGFSFANMSQVGELYTNAGLVDFSGAWLEANASGALLLNDVLGCLFTCNQFAKSVQGLAELDVFDPLRASVSTVSWARFQGADPTTPAGVVSGLYDVQFKSNIAGSGFLSYYLVRQTPLSVVPLPATLPLFGTGLAVMGFIGWRRKRKMATA